MGELIDDQERALTALWDAGEAVDVCDADFEIMRRRWPIERRFDEIYWRAQARMAALTAEARRRLS
jgi:hypothetical protein